MRTWWAKNFKINNWETKRDCKEQKWIIDLKASNLIKYRVCLLINQLLLVWKPWVKEIKSNSTKKTGKKITRICIRKGKFWKIRGDNWDYIRSLNKDIGFGHQYFMGLTERPLKPRETIYWRKLCWQNKNNEKLQKGN